MDGLSQWLRVRIVVELIGVWATRYEKCSSKNQLYSKALKTSVKTFTGFHDFFLSVYFIEVALRQAQRHAGRSARGELKTVNCASGPSGVVNRQPILSLGRGR